MSEIEHSIVVDGDMAVMGMRGRDSYMIMQV